MKREFQKEVIKTGKNIAKLVGLYENKGKESYDILNLLENPNQMNSYNECIHENINILREKYKVNTQKIK